ncbi:NAD(P)-binding domain-containing protein [Cynara cardunculus var. scolymus]|uniref:NAD(P)-binding domain-containing protein n=1 Tax=Cynara cardunculus var. scolymus TaxID=59895 RepID=A0A103XR81_CYNCS|nr:NAD(P)-binding domain-containing protein [Cynara cardunculus var. scolymus]
MWIFGRKGESGFGASSTAEDVTKGIDGTGLTALVTETGGKVKETILTETPDAKVDVMELDLNSLASNTSRESKKEGRIVIVSSEGHRITYKGGINFDKINDESSSIYAYGQSKLANVLHANELTRRFKEEKVELTANSLHPGAIATNLLRHHSILEGVVDWVGKYFLKTIPQVRSWNSCEFSIILRYNYSGAATTCYVALHPQVKGVSGEYFVDSNIGRPSSVSKDSELGKKLRDFSLGMVAP